MLIGPEPLEPNPQNLFFHQKDVRETSTLYRGVPFFANSQNRAAVLLTVAELNSKGF